MREITLKKFIGHFCEDKNTEKKFCFILGAGASKPSGILTGSDLVQEWIAKLDKEDFNGTEKWLTEKNISRNDLAIHYSEIYDKRFELRRQDGFAYLEKKMEGIEPSCGYSVLAQILEKGHHNVVITTNFDSLTEDALFIYTDNKPLVIGHSALADFISTNLSRPLIVKIHHDLFLSPKNSEGEIKKLEDGFVNNLGEIFKYYIPLVIGYGGNDGSLMNFLEQQNYKDGLFWFYRNGSEPHQKIKDFVEKKKGWFVPIDGFDEFFIQLGNEMEIVNLDKKIESNAIERAKKYREQIEKITKNATKETKHALEKINERSEKSWWSYELKARAERDTEKINQIYKDGLKEFPNSAELMENYAIFLDETKKDYENAEKLYKKAVEINPNSSNYYGNYASFLKTNKRDYEIAEKYFLKSLQLMPNNLSTLGNYAIFLIDVKRDYENAEKYFLKIFELQSNDFIDFVNYLKLLIVTKKNDEAKDTIHKALEIYNKENIENDATIELYFYMYAVFPNDFPESKEKIEELLAKGIKSIGWDFSEILKIAKENNHPYYNKLIEYDKLITQE